MKIHTAQQADISCYANLLVRYVIEKVAVSGIEQVLVVGIASGGAVIAEEVNRELEGTGIENRIFMVKCQRPSSKIKTSYLARLALNIMATLPQFVSNLSRQLEHAVLSKTRNKNREVFIDRDASLVSPDIVVLVDDAVDSGYSMKAVFDYLSCRFANAKIVSSAYVVTQDDPVFMPEFYYKKSELVRFPWSSDFR